MPRGRYERVNVTREILFGAIFSDERIIMTFIRFTNVNVSFHEMVFTVGETGASCNRGKL